jgi:micrococcal nuclease
MFTYHGLIWKVVDGDTVDVSVDLGFDIWHLVRVRLAGLDAPERFTEEGKAATEYAKNALEGQFVLVTTYKTDKYGRYIAEIEVNGQSFNKMMLDNGYAVPYIEKR